MTKFRCQRRIVSGEVKPSMTKLPLENAVFCKKVVDCTLRGS